MLLKKYDPFDTSIIKFTNLFDDIFNDTFSTYEPLSDIIEEDNKYVIETMLPGFTKKDVNIKIENNKLIIEGERKLDEKINFTKRRSFYGKFKKEYYLPDHIKDKDIKAKFKDGILNLEIPKNTTKVMKKIEIT